MRKHVLLLTTTAAILICGAIAASAQAPGAQTPQPKAEDGGQDGSFGYHSGMMGMMGRGMMGGGMMGGGRGVMGSLPMRIIFSLMDADGDGTVSLQEFQAAHERIFKAMDTDHDGTLPSKKCGLLCTGTSSKRTSIADEMREEHRRRVLGE